MRVRASPRPSPARGAQVAAAMRFSRADASRPGHQPGAHGAARSARDAPAEGQRLLSGRFQLIWFTGAALGRRVDVARPGRNQLTHESQVQVTSPAPTSAPGAGTPHAPPTDYRRATAGTESRDASQVLMTCLLTESRPNEWGPVSHVPSEEHPQQARTAGSQQEVGHLLPQRDPALHAGLAAQPSAGQIGVVLCQALTNLHADASAPAAFIFDSDDSSTQTTKLPPQCLSLRLRLV